MTSVHTCSSPRRAQGFTLIELMIVVAILGILAVVAIPAFVRYMRVSKTAEAYRNMNKIAQGLTTYWSTPKHDSNGARLPCQFPGDQVETPGLTGSCCTDGEADGKCEPNETAWDTERWRAVLFKLSDKHYYVYAHGFNQPDSVSAAIAQGDLDCDGTFSTFAQIVKGYSSSGSSLHHCATIQNGVIIMRETE